MNPEAPKARVIVPGTTRRDAVIAAVAGLLILSFVGYGVVWMSKPPTSPNVLIGVVTEKQFTPQKEEQVSFSGRRIEGVKQIEGEFVLKVRVAKEDRTYDVPVEKVVYEGKQVGDKMEFVRPRSERQ